MNHTNWLNDPCERFIQERIKNYLANNKAARIVAQHLDETGAGIRPIVDHVTVRTLNVEESAKEFLKLGFVYDAKLGVLEYEDWWAKVYRKNGYPAVFIDRKTFHHIANDSFI